MPLIWDNQSQAFEESEIPTTYNSAIDAWEDTGGYKYNHDLEAWEKVWPQKLWLIKDGVPAVPPTVETRHAISDYDTVVPTMQTTGDACAIKTPVAVRAHAVVYAPGLKISNFSRVICELTYFRENNQTDGGFSIVASPSTYLFDAGDKTTGNGYAQDSISGARFLIDNGNFPSWGVLTRKEITARTVFSLDVDDLNGYYYPIFYQYVGDRTNATTLNIYNCWLE